ncbi:MAG: VOC family protein [Gammaproteobacteria bacterium]|nr:VOC family protein [Gammaproteobacteria bacterium]
MSDELRPFHLAIVVQDINLARQFYGDLLGCPEGRSAPGWVDFSLFGHQLVCHLGSRDSSKVASAVDEDNVPVPHFGVVLRLAEWKSLADKLIGKGQVFELAPKLRFVGQPGEQGTFFLLDPFGNAIEFKGFDQIDALFSR